MFKRILFFSIIVLSVFVLIKFCPAVRAAYPSQCETGQEGGDQSGCDNRENYAAILRDQCSINYDLTECSTMQNYLNAMAADCERVKPPEVTCSEIPKDGIYGREASQFAVYLEDNPINNTATPSTNTTGTNNGTLDFPTEFGLPDPQGGVVAIITNFLDWLLGIVGVIAIIAFMVSGLQYFFSAGDDKMIETAKRNMTYSIIGVIIALSGFIIIKAIDYALRANTWF